MTALSSATVLLDASALPEDRGGVGRYVDGLVPALVRLGADLVVACQPYDEERFRAAGARVSVVPAWARSTPGRLAWEQVGLPLLARRMRAAAIHSVHYTFPLLSRRPHVVTVHDLTFFTDPGVHSALKARFFRTWIRLCRRFRVEVVTPSRATADEYVRITSAPASTVTVAPLAFDSALFAPPTPAAVAGVRERLGASHGWIAFLGTLEPRKNVTALVEAYSRVAAARETPTPALVLAGGKGWDDTVEPAIERAVAAGADVRAVGYLPLDDLPAFLGGAVLVAYPSRGEGFGLPVLEAMATGAPVLTTALLSLPEVGGDAVEYTGTSSDEIADHLARLLDDPSRRADLATRALERARLFTWERCAEAHLVAYTRAEEIR